MQPLNVHFVGSTSGPWRITRQSAYRGAAWPEAPAITMVEADLPPSGSWTLSGVTSNRRYTTATEAQALAPLTAPLGRPEATLAALIPIRKSSAWWALAQDERRAIYEERSRHTTIGMEYMPRIARRLHHCRDLGGPFDFLTWFEFAPEHAPAFDELVGRLRATEEWSYVDWEVDLRLTRN